jgi:hypothetical protein
MVIGYLAPIPSVQTTGKQSPFGRRSGIWTERGAVLDAHDLERKLADFQTYYNAPRGHASFAGHTPLAFTSGHTALPADMNHVRWASHCRGLIQLPVAA